MSPYTKKSYRQDVVGRMHTIHFPDVPDGFELVAGDGMGPVPVVTQGLWVAVGIIRLLEDLQPKTVILALADQGHIHFAELFGVINGGEAADVAGNEDVVVADPVAGRRKAYVVAGFADDVVGSKGEGVPVVEHKADLFL